MWQRCLQISVQMKRTRKKRGCLPEHSIKGVKQLIPSKPIDKTRQRAKDETCRGEIGRENNNKGRRKKKEYRDQRSEGKMKKGREFVTEPQTYQRPL